MARHTVEINVHRIVPALRTGIGWVAVECWDVDKGAYAHVSTHRSYSEAEAVIKSREGN